MAGAIKKQSKTTIKEEGGTWPLNFMVFLNAAAGRRQDQHRLLRPLQEARAGRLLRGRRQARPEDRPAQRPGRLEGEGLRQGAQVRHPRDAPHRRQGKGLRESDDHAEVSPLPRAALVADRWRPRPARRALPPARSRRPRYRNPDLPATERAADLVRRMTVAEKIAQTMTDAPAIPRLGVPAYEWWNEALHGVARAGRATVFPQAIALAATFDEKLVKRVADVDLRRGARQVQPGPGARRARAAIQGLTFFSPNINIFRDPRWGRGHETFGEDPLPDRAHGRRVHHRACRATTRTTGRRSRPRSTSPCTAAPRPTGIRSTRRSARTISPTPTCRSSRPPCASGRVASVMAAYNRVNGAGLRRQPGAAGARRCAGGGGSSATWSATAPRSTTSGAHHQLVGRPPRRPRAALRAGTDLDCGRAYRHLDEALARGLITESRSGSGAGAALHRRASGSACSIPRRAVPWSRSGAADRVAGAPRARARGRRARRRAAGEPRRRAAARALGPPPGRRRADGRRPAGAARQLPRHPAAPGEAARRRPRGRARPRRRRPLRRAARGWSSTAPARIADGGRRRARQRRRVAFVGLDPRLEGEERGSRFNPGGDRLDLGLPAAQRELLRGAAWRPASR